MSFFFFVYLFLVVITAFLVILSVNPIQSVLYLILVYLFTASFFMYLGAEFLAILVFIIYVGAISILFLFVIMLLNLRTIELYNTFFNYFPIGSFIGFLFFLEIFYLLSFEFSFSSSTNFFESDVFNFWVEISRVKSNLFLFGEILYSYFWFLVIIVAVILLIAMFGSIILTVDSNLQQNSKGNIRKYMFTKTNVSKSNISF